MEKKIILFILCLVLQAQLFAGITVVGDLTQEYVVVKGNLYEGEVLVKNTGEKIEDVKIYLTDYLFSCDGKNYYGNPGEDPRSNAGWISFSPSRFNLDADDEMVVKYQINVPVADSLVGTYWSMVMVESTPQASPEEFEAQSKVGVKTIMRYGVQVVTQFGDSGEENLRFIGANLVKNQEKNMFYIDIENVGERWMRPEVWVDVYDNQGGYVGKYQSNPVRTYPGTSIRHKIDLTNVPLGSYKALVIADGGENALFGINYKLNIEN